MGSSDAPTGPPTPEERAETRRALRWVLACCVAVLALYGAIASQVTDEAYFTRLGRRHELRFVLRDVAEVDREALGEAPVTWIVGSSITREAFDAEAIEARLQAAGSVHRVRKFAFNRGAPIFSQAIVDDLPLRPGDRVVTSVAVDNFTWSWLEDEADFQDYVQTVLSADEILALRDVGLQTRIEWSLASLPPAAFWRNQTDFRKGLVKWWAWQLGLRSKEPKPKQNVSYQPYTNLDRQFRNYRKQDWTLRVDDLALRPGQSNWDGLVALERDVTARGASLHVVYVPSNPEHYATNVPEGALGPALDTLDARFGLTRLVPRTGVAYMDYKHPNNKGRPGFSSDLADVLLRVEGLPVPPREPDPWLADRDAVPAVLWGGVPVPPAGDPPTDEGD